MKIVKRPKGIKDDAWAKLQDRANNYAYKAEDAGDVGTFGKCKNEALQFLVDRWEGKKDVSAPKWLQKFLPKNYPKKGTEYKKRAVWP